MADPKIPNTDSTEVAMIAAALAMVEAYAHSYSDGRTIQGMTKTFATAYEEIAKAVIAGQKQLQQS